MTEIYTEHLYMDSGIQHDRVFQMKGQNLKPEYVDVRTVESESSGHAYLVGKVSVLTTNFEDADVAKDRETVLVCSCDDYHYNRSAGFENGDVPVTNLSHCKHCVSAYRTEKAQNDENQTEL